MIDSVAFLAPTSPPETGASTRGNHFCFAASAISTASDGSLVVMSTKTLPLSDPARAPSGAEDHLAHVTGETDDRKDDVRGGGDRLGRVGPFRPLTQQRVGLRFRAVEDCEGKARLEQMAGHGRAHDARANPPEPRLPRFNLRHRPRTPREPAEFRILAAAAPFFSAKSRAGPRPTRTVHYIGAPA